MSIRNLVISLNTTGAAFTKDVGEVERILRKIADKIESLETLGDIDGMPLYDFTGEKVGEVTFETIYRD